MQKVTIVLAAIVLITAGAVAQSLQERQQARPYVLDGWKHMRNEAWLEAARAFQQAIDTDREFEDAYYGLGLASMRLRKFGDAIGAYLKCRDLYRAESGKRFSTHQESQRYYRDRLSEVDEALRPYQSGTIAGAATQERVRQLQVRRRELQDMLTRTTDSSRIALVPAFVSLALGSAYVRTDQWGEAEREYKAAIEADPRSGEAFNNLAVVYLQTGRFKEADNAVRSAEKAGYKVHPQLKQDIKAKLG